MRKRVIIQASKCANCVAEKSRFPKLKSNKKLIGTRLILSFSYIKHITKHVFILFEGQKRYRKCRSKSIKGALSGLRQFLATERPLRKMKNAFYFTSNVLFVLKLFKLFS